jgi:hypothetical protein
MTELLREASWLLDSKTNLTRLRQEPWLTPMDIAVVDGGIAALDRLLEECSVHDYGAKGTI